MAAPRRRRKCNFARTLVFFFFNSIVYRPRSRPRGRGIYCTPAGGFGGKTDNLLAARRSSPPTVKTTLALYVYCYFFFSSLGVSFRPFVYDTKPKYIYDRFTAELSSAAHPCRRRRRRRRTHVVCPPGPRTTRGVRGVSVSISFSLNFYAGYDPAGTDYNNTI